MIVWRRCGLVTHSGRSEIVPRIVQMSELGLGLGSWSDHNIGMFTTAGVQGAAPLGKNQLEK